MVASTHWREDGDGNLESTTGKVLIQQKARTETVTASRAITLADMGKLLYVTNPGVTLTLVDVGTGEYEFRVRAFYDVTLSGGTLTGNRTISAGATATLSKLDPSDNIWERQGSDEIFGDASAAFRARPFASMADLRVIDPVNSQKAETLGYAAPGDGGGTSEDSSYWLGATGAPPGTYAHDGGITIVPSGGDGSAAWIRISHNDVLWGEWFGASPSASASTNVAALNTAFAIARDMGYREVRLRPGNFQINDTLLIDASRNVAFWGAGALFFDNATKFTWVGADDRAAMRIQDSKGCSVNGFYFACTSSFPCKIWLEIYRTSGGVITPSRNGSSHTYVTGSVNCALGCGVSIDGDTDANNSENFFDDVVVQNYGTLSGTYPSWHKSAFRISNTSGQARESVFNRCAAIAGADGGYAYKGIGDVTFIKLNTSDNDSVFYTYVKGDGVTVYDLTSEDDTALLTEDSSTSAGVVYSFWGGRFGCSNRSTNDVISTIKGRSTVNFHDTTFPSNPGVRFTSANGDSNPTGGYNFYGAGLEVDEDVLPVTTSSGPVRYSFRACTKAGAGGGGTAPVPDMRGATDDLTVETASRDLSEFDVNRIAIAFSISGGGDYTIRPESVTNVVTGSEVSLHNQGTDDLEILGATGVTINDDQEGTLLVWPDEQIKLRKTATANTWTLLRFFKPPNSEINAQSGTTYTLAISDTSRTVECTNASGCTVTIPTDASVDIPDHATVAIRASTTSGGVTLTTTGITLEGSTTIAAGTMAVFRKRSTNTWTRMTA